VRSRITGQQHADLVPRAHEPQHAQQAGDAGRVIEGGVRGGAGSQRGDLIPRAREYQLGQQADDAAGRSTMTSSRPPTPSLPCACSSPSVATTC
jgi:hypothetical protein